MPLRVFLSACNFVALAVGSSQLNWHLRSTGTSSAAPLVTIDDVITKTELKDLYKHIEANNNTYNDFSDTWLPIMRQPRNSLQLVVQKITAVDLREVLPDSIASRIAGVTYRVSLLHPCKDAPFRFDNDTGTIDSFPGVPLLSPLLSTVTYLTGNGGPTVVLNYTASGPLSASTVPRTGFVVMPKKGKHVAFDFRLLRGVLGGLNFVPKSGKGSKFKCSDDLSHLTELRVVLGIDFWETQPAQTLPKDSSAWPPPGSDSSVTKEQLDVKTEGSHRVVAVGGDLSNAVATKAAGSKKVAVEACPRSSKRWDHEEDDFEEDAAEPEQRFVINFQSVNEVGWFRNGIVLRLPTKKVLEKEGVQRGQTLQFRTACEDVSFVNATDKSAEYQENEALHKVVSYMLKVRCGIFGGQHQDMIPSSAASACNNLSSSPQGGRSEL